MLSWKLSWPHWGSVALLNPTRHMLIGIFHKALHQPMLPNIWSWETTVNYIRNQQTGLLKMWLCKKDDTVCHITAKNYLHKLQTTLKVHTVIVLLNKKFFHAAKFVEISVTSLSMITYIASNNDWTDEMKTTVQATATTYLISYCKNQHKKLQDNTDSILELHCSTRLRQMPCHCHCGMTFTLLNKNWIIHS